MIRVALLARLFVSIVVLHLIQIGLWAAVFWQTGQLPTLEAAVYLSLVTYSTIGFGDVVLRPPWRVGDSEGGDRRRRVSAGISARLECARDTSRA